ncbi:DUF2169 family type VI secretion system accessory protein [Agrobacterium vitis]|uniref:DUF2169 domain-containing protein n=1 Tax=Agrobacterium vitis TaxID=373 RepID=A0AAE2RAW0_AGRVI|nr:DUF2169 domain-containing protein [Agrobacterium vitis]MBF2715073.1 DUF2169 domain-containing protein [Agrobacterium vitis]
MPELINNTPYPNFRYYSRDNQDREFGIVIVKATYEIAPSGRLLVAEEQAPMVFTDLCHGDVNVSSLWHPSDMVPNKPATDVIVNAVARTAGGDRKPSWECGIVIEDDNGPKLEKWLQVTGPREWQPRWKRDLSEREKGEWRKHRRLFDRWILTEPEPISALPLHYEYAYGGEVPQGQDDNGNQAFDTDTCNPIGRGKLDQDWSDHTIPHPAPQIELLSEPIAQPYKTYSPQSLGPIPPAWDPRLPLAGTYDQNWIDNIWPAWAPDYSFAFHNSAHPDLVVHPYLKGTERFRLIGLCAKAQEISFSLPDEHLFVEFVGEDNVLDKKNMVLDTVFLDISAVSRRDWRVFLSWRVNFPPGVYEQAILNIAGNEDFGQHAASKLKIEA